MLKIAEERKNKSKKKLFKTDEELESLGIDKYEYVNTYFNVLDKLLKEPFLDLNIFNFQIEKVSSAIFANSSVRNGYARCQRIVDYFEMEKGEPCPQQYTELLEHYKKANSEIEEIEYDCKAIFNAQKSYYSKKKHVTWLDLQNAIAFDLFSFVGFHDTLRRLRPEQQLIEGFQRRVNAMMEKRYHENIEEKNYLFIHPHEHRCMSEHEFEQFFERVMGEVPIAQMKEYLIEHCAQGSSEQFNDIVI